MTTYIINGERIQAGSYRIAELSYKQIAKARGLNPPVGADKLSNDARLARTQPRGG